MGDPSSELNKQAERRRAFLKQSATAAIAAPAVALLLSSGAKPAFAATGYVTTIPTTTFAGCIGQLC